MSNDHKARTGDLAAFKGSGIEKWDREERAKIDAVVKDKFDRRVADLVKGGHSNKRAGELAQEEIDNPKILNPVEEKDDSHVRAVEGLMDVHREPAKHGRGSSPKRKLSPKPGKPICENCHLEANGCECTFNGEPCPCAPCRQYRRSPKKKRGRPYVGGRSYRFRGRCSKQTLDLMSDLGVSPGEIVERFMKAAVAAKLHPRQIMEQLPGKDSS